MSLRTTVSALLVAVACSAAAQAGDVSPAWTHPLPSTNYDWTGLYIGAHAGVAGLDTGRNRPLPGVLVQGRPLALEQVPSLPSLPLATAPAPWNAPQHARAAATFGVQGGYNHQPHSGSGLVLGIETDVTGRSTFPKN